MGKLAYFSIRSEKFLLKVILTRSIFRHFNRNGRVKYTIFINRLNSYTHFRFSLNSLSKFDLGSIHMLVADYRTYHIPASLFYIGYVRSSLFPEITGVHGKVDPICQNQNCDSEEEENYDTMRTILHS